MHPCLSEELTLTTCEYSFSTITYTLGLCHLQSMTHAAPEICKSAAAADIKQALTFSFIMRKKNVAQVTVRALMPAD